MMLFYLNALGFENVLGLFYVGIFTAYGGALPYVLSQFLFKDQSGLQMFSHLNDSSLHSRFAI